MHSDLDYFGQLLFDDFKFEGGFGMSTVGYVQLFFLVIGFVSGFVLPVAATILLERREKRFVTSWYSRSHRRNSELEERLAAKVRLGSRASFFCAAAIIALWAIKNF